MLPEFKSAIWHPSQISAYDIFDIVKPDVYLTHALMINTEAVQYMKSNKSIKMVISTNGLNQKETEELEDLIQNQDINCAFLFNDALCSNKTKQINTVCVNAGADVFVNVDDASYDIDKAIIVNDSSEIKEYDGSYHIISPNSKVSDNVDLFLPSAKISSIIKNYKEVVFRSLEGSSQLLYDCIYYGNKVILDFEDKDYQNKTLNIINKVLKIDISNEAPEKIKETVTSKHTCLNRAKSLLSQFSCKQQLEHLDMLIEQYRNRVI
jgi:hypothetical protein